jgi:transposase
MNQFRPLDLGWAVPQASLAVAYSATDHEADVISLGPVGTRHVDRDNLGRTLPSTATHLRFASEAGPCGYWRDRDRRQHGSVCGVVAPSVIPQTAGDRAHTDRRHAVPWARLLRAGELPPVYVPPVEDDARRERCRARAEALADRKAAPWRLHAFVLRHESRSPGPATWGPAPLRGLSEVVCPTPAPQLVFPASVRVVTAHTERLQRLAQALQEHVKAWRVSPVVEALQALPGVQVPAAVTTGAALGALPRVANPSQLLKDLGLIPAG